MRKIFCLGTLPMFWLPTLLAHGETIRIAGEKQVATYSCASENVAVSGNQNTVTFTGICHSVTVTGSGNHIVLEQARKITIPGNYNIVSWRRGTPPVSDTGSNNHAAMEANDGQPTRSNARTDESQQTPGGNPPPVQ